MQVVGKIDRIDLPLLGLENLDVKIDTGADSCSIHCHNIKISDDCKKVVFNLLDPDHIEYNEREYELDISRISSVKSSNGESQDRIFIKSEVLIFGKTYRAEISLADRSNMRFPMLIGRRFLKNRFIVDVSKKYLSYNQKLENKKYV